MPDLGKYAAEVLMAYGISLVLILGLIWWSLRSAARVEKELSETEARRDGRN